MATDRHHVIVADVRCVGSPAAMLRVRKGRTYALEIGPFTPTRSPADADTPRTYAQRRTMLDKLRAGTAGAAGAGVREGFTITHDLTLVRARWPYPELGTSQTTAEGSRIPVHDRETGHCLGRAGSVE